MSKKRTRHVDKLRRERICKFFFRHRSVGTHILALVLVSICLFMIIPPAVTYSAIYDIEEAIGTYNYAREEVGLRGWHGSTPVTFWVYIDGKEYTLYHNRSDFEILKEVFSDGDEITYYHTDDLIVYFKLPDGTYVTTPEEFVLQWQSERDLILIFFGFVLLASIYGWLTNFGDDNVKFAGLLKRKLKKKTTTQKK